MTDDKQHWIENERSITILSSSITLQDMRTLITTRLDRYNNVTDNSNLYSIHDQTPFEFSYPCQCVFSVVKFFSTGKLRVSESVTQCQKRTTQYMFFIICSTDSHRYPKNKPSDSSFSTAVGTGGKSRVSFFQFSTNFASSSYSNCCSNV